MAFKQGHVKIGGRKKGSTNTKVDLAKDFVLSTVTKPEIRKKYLRELKALKGKQFVDAVNNALEFSIPKMQRQEGSKSLPNITLNFIAATPENKTIDIDYEQGQISKDNRTEDTSPRLQEGNESS